MIVRRPFGMDVHAVAEAVDMFVESWFKPDFAQYAAVQPLRREGAHFGDYSARVNVGRAENLKRASRAPALRQSCAFKHYRACISPRHIDVWSNWARVYP